VNGASEVSTNVRNWVPIVTQLVILVVAIAMGAAVIKAEVTQAKAAQEKHELQPMHPGTDTRFDSIEQSMARLEERQLMILECLGK